MLDVSHVHLHPYPFLLMVFTCTYIRSITNIQSDYQKEPQNKWKSDMRKYIFSVALQSSLMIYYIVFIVLLL
jgi:hypothetical protein